MYRVVALALLVAAVGCSGSDHAPTAPVSGTVTLDGEPVAKGTIVFEMAGSRPATGRIENGKIVDVTSYEKGDGAAVGQNQVGIGIVEEAAAAASEATDPGQAGAITDMNYMSGKSLIPPKYNNPAESGLTAEVTADGPNEFTFEISSTE